MRIILLLLAFLSPLLLSAQSLWHDIPKSTIPPVGPRHIVPKIARTISIDLNVLQPLLQTAPLRFSPEADLNTVTIELPRPDGRSTRFLLTESPTMHPTLQARHPDIRCYTGTGIDDPGAYLKCDLTMHGFHAQVLNAKGGDWYIDPYSMSDREHYSVYFKKDYTKPGSESWFCETAADDKKKVETNDFAQLQGDCKLRQYTLALACTGEYAAFHGGTAAAAEAAMNTSLNRVNGVYELEIAVTMSLVDNNDTLIFLDANTDPYTNNNGSAMLTQNQTTCTNRIGSANYDIGHVFSTGGGGVAFLGCVCNNTNKAKGVTGSGSPIGDGFDIDYVAHEMGHQFGCDHTFNGTHGSCSGNNVPASAYEPGSGTTIMAYAGICSDQDVQPHSDAYFHARSLQQAGAFITGGSHTCDTEVVTGNGAPTANAGNDYTIPKSTPFILTGVGTDPDGNPITYCWEQYDNQTSTQPPLATSTGGPNFRSLTPTSSPERYLPNLEDVINNVSPVWEVLPSVGRTLNFRLTVRDNFGGGGCTKEDNMVVTVNGTAGPFLVTTPNTALSWQGNTTQTVTWNVASTNIAPVSCANVKISLSTDGGFTYPTVILGSTPNDGTEAITVPNIPSTSCRIRIEGVGNIFYDISNVNFTITAGLPVELLAFDATLKNKNQAFLTWATASEKENKGFEIQQARKNESGAIVFETIGFEAGHGSTTERHDYQYAVKDLEAGDYYFRLRQLDFDGQEAFSPARSLSIHPAFMAKALPNPFQNELEIQVYQEKTANVSVYLVNQWGQKTELLSNREVAKGHTSWRFNLADMPGGAYHILCYQEGQPEAERLLVVKR